MLESELLTMLQGMSAQRSTQQQGNTVQQQQRGRSTHRQHRQPRQEVILLDGECWLLHCSFGCWQHLLGLWGSVQG